MSFRGKQWAPPDPEQVAEFIKDKMSLTELSLDSLKDLLSNNQLEILTGEVDNYEEDDKVSEIAEENLKNLRVANKTYYATLARLDVNMLETVNIVLPVYNSIHLTEACIKAVLENTTWPYHLTIVDDASDKHTNDVLLSYAEKHPDKISLITNRKNKGFAATVNRGVKAREAQSKYTCLLNSDVLVTPLWLTKMVMALNSDKRNKIVNPVTNNTAVINVPMSSGYSYQAMNASLEQAAVRKYPEIMPTGFCFMFPNSLIKTIGYMDEAYANFGEETDFWMRTVTYSNGNTFDSWRAVLADDTYVFHQRGASYATLGEEIHMNLRKTASARFRAAWPSFNVWNKSITTKAIDLLKRKRGVKELSAIMGKLKKPSVCYVVHSPENCGAMHYIADIVNHINDNGGDARVAVILREDRPEQEPVAELRSHPIVFKSAERFQDEFVSRVFQSGLVIAATSELSLEVSALCKANQGLTSLLHAQSYEPALVDDPQIAKSLTTNFNAVENIISSSDWITKAIGKPVIGTVNPGVDRSIFYPGDRMNGDERPTVMFALNGAYPFKGANRGIVAAQSLLHLAKKRGKDIRILGYGANAITGVPDIVCAGYAARTRIARLLSTEVDIFVDPALNHSYGMPSLEAIACGVPVVGWDNQGIREYLPKGYMTDKDVIHPNDTPPMQIAERIFDLLFDDEGRKKIADVQAKTALIKNHDRHLSVEKFTKLIYDTFGTKSGSKKIVVVTPHLRKHGGPTTILTLANELAKRGHEVTVATVYADINPEVVHYTDLPVVLLRQSAANIPPCDLIITNSDNPLNQEISNIQGCKKIMLKLSHNPRFKQLEEIGLQCKWDAIITSSQWLVDVCENPTPAWNYKPVKATRVGWFHYNFEKMRRSSKRKKFRGANELDPVIISTLIHAHPSKGSIEAGQIFASLKKAYGNKIHLIGVGEIPPKDVKLDIPGMEYVYAPSRDELADLLFKSDIWLSCSHSEGLGRMTLEAMTGVAACVLTDTGAEFVNDGENAMVRPVGDVTALAEAVRDLIIDQHKRREMAITGFATAKKMSDSVDFGDSLEKVIEDVF